MHRLEAWIITQHPAATERLCSILYTAGITKTVTAKTFPPHTALSAESIVILYHKSHISARIAEAAALSRETGCRILLLLDPDRYVHYLDAAREANIMLLLMPVAAQTLLDVLSESPAAS